MNIEEKIVRLEQKLDNFVDHIYDGIEKCFEKIEELEKLKFHKNMQIDENRKVSREIDALRAQIISLKMIYHSNNEALCSSDFNVQKTKGLSFEEAITAFKKGKKIKHMLNGGEFYITTEKIYCFHSNEIMSNDWKIVE